MAKMAKAKKVARTITGFSTPIFGLSWNPPKDQREIVRKLLTFLEDRRALTRDHNREVSPHVTESVLQIRTAITETLQEASENPVLVEPLRAMRAACRRYLDQVGPPHDGNHMQFVAALGELRGAFGIHLAALCTSYGIEVEDELAAIFPATDVDEKAEAE